MLLELRIKDLALIEEASVEFAPGLNILTGETGAGKTVVVEAINLLTGGRADTTLVRKGADRARVEGRFDLTGVSLPAELVEFVEGDELVISRVLSKEGKNRCYMNGGPATVGLLAKLGEALVDLHGQHDQQSLFRISSHLDFLDTFAGGGVIGLRTACAVLVTRRRELESDLEKLEAGEKELLARVDLLRFQVEEIERAQLDSGEEERLLEERELLRHIEKVSSAVSSAEGLVTGGTEGESALDSISLAQAALKGAQGIDGRLDKLAERISGAFYELEDCAHELRDYISDLSFPPGRLDEVEARLSEISFLRKKYGQSIAEVLSYRDKAEQELAGIENLDASKEKLASELGEVKAELGQVAVRLSEARREAAVAFEDRVIRELADLGMAGAGFEVAFKNRESEYGYRISERGMEEAEFLISPNAGEEFKALTKIASGGEISRVMLAIKIVVSAADPVPTMIFDEIDAGIGGEVANAVGAKLFLLGRRHQVMVVTHLPQIARFANEHYLIIKEGKGERTVTGVTKLDDQARARELARMLSGEIASEAALRHAKELLEETVKTAATLSEN